MSKIVKVETVFVELFGLPAGYLLSWMISKKKTSFYVTVKEVKKEIWMKKEQQAIAINKLIEAGLLEKSVKGLPAKRFIDLNMDRITTVIAAYYNDTKGSNDE